MYRFMMMMDKENSMFAGLYWAHDRIDMMMMLKQKMPQYNYIIGTMSSMIGWMAEGMHIASKYKHFANLKILSVFPSF